MIADAILEQYNSKLIAKLFLSQKHILNKQGAYKAKAHIYRDIYAEFEFEIVSDEPIAENTDVETSENEEK